MSTLALELTTLDSRDFKVISLDGTQLADLDGSLITVELEVVDEFSPVFFFLFTKFEAEICLFFDLLSRWVNVAQLSGLHWCDIAKKVADRRLLLRC